VKNFRRRLAKEEPLRDILGEANREDRLLVDRAFRDLWPRQVEAYPGDLEADTRAFQEENRNTARPAKEPWTARLYRDAVFKPLRPLLLPDRELPEAEASEWL
jgi:hypothetical protein